MLIHEPDGGRRIGGIGGYRSEPVAELGLERPEPDWPALLADVKALGARKHDLVTDEEFRELVDAR